MATSNITIRIEAELAREAKILAARREVSLSRLVAECLEKAVRDDHAFAAARRRALRRLRTGYDLHWQAPRDRGELYRTRSP